MILPFLVCDGRKSAQLDIDLMELTVDRIHQAYKDKRYSCAQLVQAYIDRIGRYDEKINAAQKRVTVTR